LKPGGLHPRPPGFSLKAFLSRLFSQGFSLKAFLSRLFSQGFSLKAFAVSFRGGLSLGVFLGIIS